MKPKDVPPKRSHVASPSSKRQRVLAEKKLAADLERMREFRVQETQAQILEREMALKTPEGIYKSTITGYITQLGGFWGRKIKSNTNY